MDELVERVAAELARRHLSISDGYYKATARAIIPIVQDWQRERDAGIAEGHFVGIGNAYEAAGNAIATAIRNQETGNG